MITIATHASASQKAASKGIGTPFHLRGACQRGVPLARFLPQARVSRIHSATVSAIFARGPAGAKS